MTDRKLLEQALEALEVATTPLAKDRQEVLRAQAALRERLAKPDPRNQCGETCERAKLCAVCLADMGAQPEQEPVAWMYVNKDGECEQIEYGVPYNDPSVTPLYTAPPQREWQGLTDEEISAIIKSIPSETDLWVAKCVFAREIEAKLKEKND